MGNISKANRIREIADEIAALVNEAKSIAKNSHIFYANYEAYVFEQIEEHISKGNPYNKDLNDLANDLENEEEEEEVAQ